MSSTLVPKLACSPLNKYILVIQNVLVTGVRLDYLLERLEIPYSESYMKKFSHSADEKSEAKIVEITSKI